MVIQIPSVSAQEAPPGEAAVRDGAPPAENPLRVAEQAIAFGDEIQTERVTAGSSVWAIIRMVLVLALVATAIYGVVFFLKKSSRQTAVSDPFLKILATAHLGGSRYAHIVCVGGKAWLLGSSDGGVNLIGEIDDKELIDAMLLEDSNKSANAPSGKFQDFLSVLRKMGAPAKSKSPTADDIKSRRERLKGL